MIWRFKISRYNPEVIKKYYEAHRDEILEYKRQWRKQPHAKAAHDRYRVSPKGRYAMHKKNAEIRGIPWEFTFETWWAVWEDSGKWAERGRGGYMMCRFGDTGPYSPTNVRIDTVVSNARERSRLKLS